MKTADIAIIGGVILFIMIIAGSADDDRVPPDYTVTCVAPESSDECTIIDRDGKVIMGIAYPEAVNEDLINKPENIQNWLDTQK
jgi:hypothetical protein